MKRILKIWIVLTLITCCIGVAYADDPIDPYFSEAQITPDMLEFTEETISIGPGLATTRSVSIPSGITTGSPATFTASAGYSSYMFWIYSGEGTYIKNNEFQSENTFTYTFQEPGTYYLMVCFESEDVYTFNQFTVGGANLLNGLVTSIVSQCPVSGEYEKALWLHDYLIMHAYYDSDYKRYGPDGVLVDGLGVCDSYSKAYEMLLSAAGIQSVRVLSSTHAWNSVFLEGAWYNIDCTWDDPTNSTEADKVPVSGNERHLFFGIPNSLMFQVRSHQPTSSYPYAESIDCNYGVRENAMTWHDQVAQDIAAQIADYQQVFAINLSTYYPIGGGWWTSVQYPVLNYGLSRMYLEKAGFTNRGRQMTLSVSYDATTDPWHMGIEAHYVRVQGEQLLIHAEVIEREAFQGTGAKAVRLSAGSNLEELTFANMKQLEEVYIPDSITHIADSACNGWADNLLIVTSSGSAAVDFAKGHGYCLDVVEGEN